MIFEDKNNARVIWSKNLDVDDIYSKYPPLLEYEGHPGVLESMNMNRLTRLQRSYRWQPHLPFMPVKIENDPWTERYNFKYATLPIEEVSPGQWTLAQATSSSWERHVSFFSRIIIAFRQDLSRAPITVTNLPDIRNYPLNSTFATEKKARGYFWFAHTLIFSLFAKFAYVIAGRPKWRETFPALCDKLGFHDIDEVWIDEVEVALCNFTRTKRAGVIVDVSTTELWAILPRYMDNGVPLFMDVGKVVFHDREREPSPPTITISNVTGSHKYDIYPPSWPKPTEILEETREYLKKYYEERLGGKFFEHKNPPLQPLTLPRPHVEAPGSEIHQRANTSAWLNPETNQPVDFLQVSNPKPADLGRVKYHVDWVEFFDKRRKENLKKEENETPVDKQRQQSQIKDSIRINQKKSMGPSKKSDVYKWEQVTPPTGEFSWRDDWEYIWERIKVEKCDIDYEWGRKAPTQRVYDPFRNQWDLMVLFDVAAEIPDVDDDFEDDDDDDMDVDHPAIDPNQRLAYLDQLNVAPTSNPYSSIDKLTSHIAFIAPTNLGSWCYLMLGLRCFVPLPTPIVEPDTKKYIGFFLDDDSEKSPVLPHLNEFVSYILADDLTNPRMEQLSDFHPRHPL